MPTSVLPPFVGTSPTVVSSSKGGGYICSLRGTGGRRDIHRIADNLIIGTLAAAQATVKDITSCTKPTWQATSRGRTRTNKYNIRPTFRWIYMSILQPIKPYSHCTATRFSRAAANHSLFTYLCIRKTYSPLRVLPTRTPQY